MANENSDSSASMICATLLRGQGGALDQVPNILGHVQISVTHQHYQHMERDQKRKAMNTLAGLST